MVPFCLYNKDLSGGFPPNKWEKLWLKKTTSGGKRSNVIETRRGIERIRETKSLRIKFVGVVGRGDSPRETPAKTGGEGRY